MMEAPNSYLSNESGDVAPKEVSKAVTFGPLWSILGKVLLAGIGFFIGCFLGLLLALYSGLIEFAVC